jgi:aspartyl-tRNA(Asn)/glutamyl-tRNA(Gln) amidotransferase subunit A
MKELFTMTISEASSLIRKGKITPLDLLSSVLERIDTLESKLDAWVTLDIDRAKEAAEKLTGEAEEGKFRSMIHGIPIGVKDIFFTAGLKTTMGSSFFKDYVPEYDAQTVMRLREAGAIIPGKTETTEFAAYDPAPTRNPWNLEHTPGGSSSGSVAAVSSGMCHTALGSQTGGSVVRPASFCGIIGLKPTYDLISRTGVYPLSWSLDHVGFFTRTVEDASIMLNTLTQRDKYYPIEMVENKTPRLGLLRGYFEDRAAKEVWDGFISANEMLRDAGADIAETSLPEMFSVVHPAHRVIFSAEASSVHEERFKTRMLDFKAKMRGMIAAGLLIPASTYLKAKRIQERFIFEAKSMLRGLDAIITPSTVTPALKGLESTGDPAFNAPWSFCGFPSITIPSGLTNAGLPLGFQIVCAPFKEKKLLSIASWCENIFGFPKIPRNP